MYSPISTATPLAVRSTNTSPSAAHRTGLVVAAWALCVLGGCSDDATARGPDADDTIDSVAHNDVAMDTGAAIDADGTAQDTGTGKVNGSPCDDGRVCTVDDRWIDGACAAGVNICPCEPGHKACPSAESGDVLNLCLGPRQCVPTAPGAVAPYACVANPAQHKVCDASIDTLCTKNACAPQTGKCAPTPVERTVERCDVPGGGCRLEVLGEGAPDAIATPCDDGLSCTIGDKCKAGACAATTSVCDCAKDSDCEDDGDLCNGTPYCNKATETWKCAINPATIVSCDTSSDSVCAKTSCAPETGVCTKNPIALGVPCDDGVDCSEGDACDGEGKCQSGAWTCCKTDFDCEAEEDGDLCNGTLFCNLASGSCELNPTTVVTCPTAQNDACKTSQCAKDTGKCALEPVNEGKACDDGVACTKGEVCTGGSCVGGTSLCPCKQDADCKAKDDGDLCNGELYCNLALGECKPNPTTVVVCQTVNDTDCAKNTCDPKTGACAPLNVVAGAVCDADGTTCTLTDTCDGKGQCLPGVDVCACKKDSDCAPSEDGNLCNGTLFCDLSGSKPTCKLNPSTVLTCPSAADTACTKNTCLPLTGGCKMTALSTDAGCDDGEACTGEDHCDGEGGCKPGTKALCPCQDTGECDPFNDSDVCNGNYLCLKGNCTFDKKPKNCDDGSACTVDACDKVLGCTHTSATTGDGEPAPCDDGNACTVLDVCTLGVCKAGAAKGCNDGKPCTEDGCDPQKGCTTSPLAAGTALPCYAGPAGTSGVGICKAGTRLCDGKGGVGKCTGEVLPKVGDDCGGGDEDCDGDLDEDCVGAAKLTMACGAGQSGPPGHTLFEPFMVRAVDIDDNAVANVKITWTAPAGGSFASAQTLTDALGFSSNPFTLGKDSGKVYTGRAAIGTTGIKVDIDASSDAKLPTTLFDYRGFCEVSKLKLTGVASIEPGRVAVVSGGDNQNGSMWFAEPLAKDTSFKMRVDVSGFTAGYSLVVQATDKGAATPAGGYADGDTLKLVPALAARISGTKGGGKVNPATLNIAANGTVLATVADVLPLDQNDKPRSWWLDYSHDNKKLELFTAALGVAKPAVPVASVTVNLWGTLAGSGKPAYVGVTAGNSSAGVNGSKYVEDWWFSYTNAPCFTDPKAVCDDGTDCTDDSCDKAKGCVFAANTKPCDDGDACTKDDACKAKGCASGESLVCDDGNACTDDGCDKATGCTTKANTAPCDDGDACTGDDTCKGSACTAGAAVDCDDKIACTADSCDAAKGCVHSAADEVCDDGNACTVNSCDVSSGCVLTPVDAGTAVSCYEGPKDTADTGICKAGTRTCDGKGGSSACANQVLPKAIDECGNGDEDCDSAIDEDCGVTAKVSVNCGANQVGKPGSELLDALTIRVKDVADNDMVNKKVTWTAPDGGSFSSTTTTTDALGFTKTRFTLGGQDGKVYTARASIEGTSTSYDIKATAKASEPNYFLNYDDFCDDSLLKTTGVAAVQVSKVILVSGGDNQNGSFWHTKPLTKDTSFSMRVDVSGYTRGYSMVFQSTNSGTSVTAGGYGDGGTTKLNPAIVAQVTGTKGGGAYSAGTLGLYANGATLKTLANFTPYNQNDDPRSIWFDYDHGSKVIKIYIAGFGAAKPANPVVAVIKDLWSVVGSNGKPAYVGFTGGNSSGGSNGTKVVENWTLTYL